MKIKNKINRVADEKMAQKLERHYLHEIAILYDELVLKGFINFIMIFGFTLHNNNGVYVEFAHNSCTVSTPTGDKREFYYGENKSRNKILAYIDSLVSKPHWELDGKPIEIPVHSGDIEKENFYLFFGSIPNLAYKAVIKVPDTYRVFQGQESDVGLLMRDGTYKILRWVT